MKIKHIANGVKYLWKNGTKFAKFHLPEILRLTATGAMVGGAVLAAKEGAKTSKKIEEKEEELGRELTFKEKVVEVGSDYIPAVVCEVSGIVLMAGAEKLTWDKVAALTSIANSALKDKKEYKEVVKEVIGEDKEKDIQKQTTAKLLNSPEFLDNIPVLKGGGKTLFHEPILDRWFYGKPSTIRKAMYDLTKEVETDEYATVRDFYDILNIPEDSLISKHFVWKMNSYASYPSENVIEAYFCDTLFDETREIPYIELSYNRYPENIDDV